MASFEKSEPWAIIKFCFERGISPTKTYEMMRKHLQKKPCPGHKFLSGIVGSEKAVNLVRLTAGRRSSLDVSLATTAKDVDRRVTIRDICDDTRYSYGTVQRVLTEKLNMKKVSARWIPHLLTEQHKQKRVATSRRILSRFRCEGVDFLDRIITADETWEYLFDPDQKEQSRQWKTPGSPAPKKARVTKTSNKQMYIFFADRKGMILQHAVPIGQSVTTAYYGKVLRRYLTRALKAKRPDVMLHDVIPHHDNAPSHTAETTRLEIDVIGFETLEHPPYSPDLGSMDFRVFPTVKSALKGHRFDSFEWLACGIRRVVSGLDSNWYANMFEKWTEHHLKCIAKRGEYIET